MRLSQWLFYNIGWVLLYLGFGVYANYTKAPVWYIAIVVLGAFCWGYISIRDLLEILNK